MAKRKGEFRKCLICNKEFYAYRYVMKLNQGKFCSRQCAGKAIEGKPKKDLLIDKVKYSGLHMWAKRWLEKPNNCEICNEKKDKLHLANKSGKYKRDLKDWLWLCPICHSEYDGNSKIVRADEGEILKRRNNGETFVSIAKRFGVSRKVIAKRYHRLSS